MKRKIYFCKSWFRAKKRPTEMWSKKQAEEAHLNKKLYTVLVDSADRPHCFLEITDKFAGVCFLDDLFRESLTYHFQEVEPGKLFLSMGTHREFEGDTDKVANGTSYMFKQDGTVNMRREFFNPHRLETAKTSADVTPNYSQTPKFGEYDDLIRVERERLVVLTAARAVDRPAATVSHDGK